MSYRVTFTSADGNRKFEAFVYKSDVTPEQAEAIARKQLASARHNVDGFTANVMERQLG